MTYIAEPGIDVLDRSCLEERQSTASTKADGRSTSRTPPSCHGTRTGNFRSVLPGGLRSPRGCRR